MSDVYHAVVCFSEVRGLGAYLDFAIAKPHKYYADVRSYNLTKMCI